MKKRIIFAAIVVVAILWWSKKQFFTNSNVTAPPETWVEVSRITEHTLPIEINVIGSLTARSVEITPESAGHVKAILFKNGTFVQKDTPLLQLDDEVYITKYNLAKAKLFYSKTDLNRRKLLGKKGVIAQQAIDEADADYKQKFADAEEAKVELNKMKLIAPFAGVLGKRKINRGDYVTIGQSIVTLTDTHHLHVDYSVPEHYLPLLHLGQIVNITASAYPGKPFKGKVAYIAPTINVDNRSIALYAELNNEQDILRPGMFVNVVQALGAENKVLMIPMRSLVPSLEGQQVYKIQDGKAYPVKVSIGKRILDKVQIIEGLAPGDVIITDGQLKVKPGMPVKIKS